MNESGVVKVVAKLSLVAMSILLLLAMIFYKERAFFADASYIAFSIINNKSLCIQEHRYGSFVTQIVPYIGQMLHLPIRAILIAYSISFNVFYLAVACILYRLRQYSLTILMTLYYLLFFSATYFWTNNEIHQAVAWMFLFFGVTLWLGEKKVKLVALIVPFILLSFLAIFTHFIVVIPMFFLWVFLWIEKKHWPLTQKESVVLSVLLVAVLIIKYYITRTSSYDGEHLHGITHFSIPDVVKTFIRPVAEMFFQRCIANYWISIIALIAGVTALINQGKKALAIWTTVCIVGYIIVMGLTYGGYDKNLLLFHIESEWACIGILVAAPFVYGYLPGAKMKYAICLFVVIVVTRLGYIGYYAGDFSKRVQCEEQVLLKMKQEKITKLAIINTDQLRKDNVQDWAIPYESMMMSASMGDMQQRTFFMISDDDTAVRKNAAEPVVFMTAFGPVTQKDWNTNYFNIDTTQPYTVMTYNELMK